MFSVLCKSLSCIASIISPVNSSSSRFTGTYYNESQYQVGGRITEMDYFIDSEGTSSEESSKPSKPANKLPPELQDSSDEEM